MVPWYPRPIMVTNNPQPYDCTCIAIPLGNFFPSTPEPPSEDQRHNRKFQALWFREFIDSISAKISPLILPELPVQHVRVVAKSRSAPPAQREWKMKDWKQAL
jgi:hypothetical protein